MKYSVVVPVKDEAEKLYNSLISLCKLNPSEIILCTDNPTPKSIIIVAKVISKKFRMSDRIHILAVVKNKEYLYHQAWVRRSGFLAAKNDIILTSDADLIVNKNVLKGLKIIGQRKIGLVTFAQLQLSEKSPIAFVRLITTSLMRVLHFLLFRHVRDGDILSGFTGLYWVYRPYWMDTEGDSIQSLPIPIGKGEETHREKS